MPAFMLFHRKDKHSCIQKEKSTFRINLHPFEILMNMLNSCLQIKLVFCIITVVNKCYVGRYITFNHL